jgi:hypothetical protein
MATFRKRSRKYRNKNTRRNIRRKYIKARKSRINRRSRKSLVGGVKFPSIYSFAPSFLTRRSAAVAPAPDYKPQIDPLSISGESNNRESLLPEEDDYDEDKPSRIQLNAANRMAERIAGRTDRQSMEKEKTAESKAIEATLFANSLKNLSTEDTQHFNVLEKNRIKPENRPLSELWEGAASAYMDPYNR